MLNVSVCRKLDGLVLASNRVTQKLCEYLAELDRELNEGDRRELKNYMRKRHRFTSAMFEAHIRVGRGEVPVELIHSKIPDYVIARADATLLQEVVTKPLKRIRVVDEKNPNCEAPLKPLQEINTKEWELIFPKGHGAPLGAAQQKEIIKKRQVVTLEENVHKARILKRYVKDGVVTLRVKNPLDSESWIELSLREIVLKVGDDIIPLLEKV